jgi:hypothetical protein
MYECTHTTHTYMFIIPNIQGLNARINTTKSRDIQPKISHQKKGRDDLTLTKNDITSREGKERGKERRKYAVKVAPRTIDLL